MSFFLWQPERERLRKEMEEEIRAQLIANQAALQESATSWEDRVKEAQEDVAPTAAVSEKERKVSQGGAGVYCIYCGSREY